MHESYMRSSSNALFVDITLLLKYPQLESTNVTNNATGSCTLIQRYNGQ